MDKTRSDLETILKFSTYNGHIIIVIENADFQNIASLS